MITRQKKAALVKELAEKVAESKTVLVCDFKGMSVAELTQLRRNLRKKAAGLKVIKKTLADRALKESGYEALNICELEGQAALVFGGEDEVIAAKTVVDFSKQSKNLKIIGGALEKKAIPIAKVMALAKLPGKQEMLGQLIGTLAAPLSSFSRVLAGNLRGLTVVLNAIKEKKE
mgnify:CR=1 FL=1